ncbi:MAG: hypothetical protein J6R59_10175 [Paludibacteraceae bacterium]|nr:hypothetical protein [Paludibacteraceae bacterium]
MTNIERFINSIESSNSQKVAKYALKNIDDNIENYNLMKLEQLILDRKPNSPKEIITVCYVLGSYSKWLQEQNIVNNDNLYQLVSSLDKKLLWKKCKPNAKKKFISEKDYQRVVKDIATYEEYNSLYYELLFSCIWNGIYSDDLSVIKNMRKSDIDDSGIVTLHEDNNHTYKIKIPERLAMDLKKLADITMWQRPNRYGICNVEMRGAYNDSVFKVEHRSTSSNGSYRFTYYSKLRKIAKEYLEHSLLPLQLYTSGIMHRIKVELKKNSISLEEAFTDNSRNKMAHLIIQKELIRCNSSIEVGNFRELVKGHLDSF